MDPSLLPTLGEKKVRCGAPPAHMGDNGFTIAVSPLLFGFIYFISRKTISSAKGSSTVLQGISCVLFVKLSGRNIYCPIQPY